MSELTDNTRSYMEDAVNTVELPTDDAEMQTSTSAEDSWVDELTPYDQQVGGGSASLPEPNVVTQQPTYGVDPAAYDDLVHIDTSVAREVTDKLITPQVKALEARLNALTQQSEADKISRTNQIRTSTNAEIMKQYPRADVILGSKEFNSFLASQDDPYDRGGSFRNLRNAYDSGNADYVIAKLDAFHQARGKPKPQVGVEPQQGRVSNGLTAKPKAIMTAEQYEAERLAILRLPRSERKPGALRELAETFRKQHLKGRP